MHRIKWIVSAVVMMAWIVQSAGATPPSLTAPFELPVRPVVRVAPPPALTAPPPPVPGATSAPAETSRAATTQAEARIKLLKAHVDQLVFSFYYLGPTDKPFYNVTLSVPDFMIQDDPDRFARKERITAAQAEKIIDLLAASGWLAKAEEGIHIINTEPNPPPFPQYNLTVKLEKNVFIGSMGFDLKMLRTFDAIRAALDDGPGKPASDGAKAMDLLIRRMTGLRKQWERN